MVAYATVFFGGAIVGFILLWLGHIGPAQKPLKCKILSIGKRLGQQKELLLSASFAVTLGVLPYVIRIEEFILANELGLDEVALFHVAQLAV